MSDLIIDRGRGPELKGTRVTVYRMMDYVREGAGPERIAQELSLSAAQVQAALDYIEAHREEVERVYEQILQRVNSKNPAWVEATLAKTPEELKQRILARRAKAAAHADTPRQ